MTGGGTIRKPSWKTVGYDELIHCMHCGLCLEVCPTYRELGVESASPRGRLALMRAVADGRLRMTERFVEDMYLCLDCRACETACPAGVQYGELVEEIRDRIEEVRRHPLLIRLIHRLVLDRIFPYPRRFKLAASSLFLYQWLGSRWLLRRLGVLRKLPWNLGEIEALMPKLSLRGLVRGLPAVTPPVRAKKHRVGFLSGCMAVFLDGANRATVRVLARNGCEVVIPRDQWCCGALHAHMGRKAFACSLARHNIEVFERAGVEVILTNAAGCGSTLKEYGDLLKDDPRYASRAQAFSDKVKDISEFLVTLPLSGEMGELKLRVTYDDPCHLLHGQRIQRQPRDLLRSIPGLELVDMAESDWCCGSAGIYNITHYDMAMRLLDRKMAQLARTKADVIASGNPGCLFQLGLGVRRQGIPAEVLHPIELVDRAYARSNEAL